MRRKILTTSILLFFLILIAGIGITYHKARQEEGIENILKGKKDTDSQVFPRKEKLDLHTLPEIRDSVDDFLEKGKSGQFRNLVFGEFYPVITSENSVCAITTRLSRGEKTLKSLDNALEVLHTFYGNSLDTDYIRNWNIEGEKLEDMRKEMAAGTFDPGMDRGFLLVFHKDEYHAQVDSSCSVMWIDTGMKGVTPSGENLLNKEYYRESTDGSLKDTYLTRTGEMSVVEAIRQAEDYFNRDFPLEAEKEIEYRVSTVYIFKLEEGKFGFDFGMRRSYRGVPFEYVSSGTYAYGEREYVDMMDAVLEGDKNITYFSGFIRNNIVDIDETYEKILSPETAMEYVSEKIGDATVYNVTGMELSYASRYKEKTGVTDADRTIIHSPVWTILAENKSDGHKTRFYVDVITGETTSRVM